MDVTSSLESQRNAKSFLVLVNLLGITHVLACTAQFQILTWFNFNFQQVQLVQFHMRRKKWAGSPACNLTWPPAT